jgi:hypothetical protein
MTSNIVLCAIDIETSGPKLIKNGILSIGICAGSVTGSILMKKRFDLNLEGEQQYDPETYEKFWTKNILVLEEIKKNAIHPRDAMINFMESIDYLDERYQLIIISDCVTFDIGFINYYLSKYLDRKPLTYNYKGEFRPVYDSDCYSRGAVGASYRNIYTDDSLVMKKLKFIVNRNGISHMPEDDAEYIYNMHRMVLIKNMR